MKRRYTLILLTILALAVVLRVIRLATREIQYDDAFSIFLSQQTLAEIVSGTAADTMPPLYYFILHFWMIATGSSLAALRILSTLFSLGALLVFFDLTRRMFGVEAGLWTAFLAAISPIQIYHAQDMRMYALLELGQALYLWFFYSMFVKPKTNQPKIGLWIGLVLAGAATLYTHNLAIFGLLIADVYLLIQRRWRDLFKLIAAQGVILVLALPWLLMIPGQIEKVQRAFWTPRPGLVEIFQAILMFTVNMPLEGVLLVLAAVFSVQIFVMVLLETPRGLRENREAWLLVLLAFLLPGMLFAISYLMRPVFVPRGFLISSLAYYGLAGWIISRRNRRGIGWALALTFTVAVAISLPSFYSYQAFPRSAFRETTSYLAQQSKAGQLILHDNKLSYFPSHYYAPGLNQAFLADEPGSANDTYAPASQQAMELYPEPDIESAVAGYKSVYFVVFQPAIDEYIRAGQTNHPVLTWLEERYRLKEVRMFSDLRVYLFAQ